MSKEYGTLPTEVLDRPAWDFWMNAKIRIAGNQFEQDMRDQAQQSGDAGVATNQERESLVADQEARADRREAADGQPDPSAQLAALQEVDDDA